MNSKSDIERMPETIAPVDGVEASTPPPWEMIENGRYRPRRIRGSYRGRELG
jgi:hypothetical protein